MSRERVDEVVRVGLNLIGIAILVGVLFYIAVELHVLFIRWAAHA